MKKLPRRLKDALIFLGLLVAVPSFIYFVSMNFGDQRVHIEKKQWNPGEAAEQNIEPQLLKRAAEYIETRLPMARGMVIIKNGRTVHEKYYWKGGPGEKDFLHSMNRVVLHALIGIAIDRQLLRGQDQLLADFFPEHREQARGLTIDDLLRIQAPVVWGKGPPEYWELFFSGDRLGAAIRIASSGNKEVNPAMNFAANFLLAEIIEKAASMSVSDFAETYLFSPMSISTLRETKRKGGPMDPFIGFELRTLDLAKLGFMIMNQGVWEGNRIISRNWAARITDLPKTKGSWGGWQPVLFSSTPCILAEGEGGQYIVLAPELDLLIAVSSKSRFPLSGNNGYQHLFGMIVTASDEQLSREALSADPEDRPYYEPNFVYATEVPEEIRQFFLDLAKDIATQDINRILYHYAKGYENKGDNLKLLDKLFLKGDDYRAMYGYWKKMFFGGTGELEFVHIEKLRIDGNLAYLRGSLKYSYANMNEGSFGWFPLENLIRLRGRWLWLGSPEYGVILDRDEYFDAEVSTELEKFIGDCGRSLVSHPATGGAACFSPDFRHNGLRQSDLHELLNHLWKDDNHLKLHITRTAESGNEAELEGYLDNSLIGSVSLPAGMKVVRRDNGWQWAGNGNE